jgi:hypothetical protein
VTYSHLSPYLRCAVGLAVLGWSGLRRTGPRHSRELTEYQAICLDRRQIKISELLGRTRLSFSLECADEPRTHVSSFSFLEFVLSVTDRFCECRNVLRFKADENYVYCCVRFVIKILVTLEKRYN